MHPCYHPPKPSCPPRPAPAQGYLMQEIIACERRSLPCVRAEWCFDGCTSGTIQQVSACGTPVWSMDHQCTLHVTLPLSIRTCDACGRLCSRSASVEMETALPHSFLCVLEDARNTLLILPCVRLICAESTGCGCFRVQLAVSLDLYLLCYEAVHCGSPKPQCPQLPLYPPPIC